MDLDNTAADRTLAQAHFDRFMTAFASFDGNAVANLFATPGVALRRDGSLAALTSREDVVSYYQAALDRYRGDGCVSCQWSQLGVTPIGRRSLLAAVTWELLRADGSVATRWRQSYCLRHPADGPLLAFASAMHVE